ncbi:MAG TPA: hypothetical protein VGD90_03970 [Sphingobacteriaceae bacterium]
MSFKFLILLPVMVLGTAAFAQSETDQIVAEIIEDLARETAEDYDFGELTERLNHYLKHPIDLNNTNQQQLAELFFLNPLQIESLLRHQENNGDYIDILELQSLDEFDLSTVRRLTPFVYIKTENTLTSFRLDRARHDLILRYGQVIQSQQGYSANDPEASRYLGSPQKYLVRYRFNSDRKISLALNMEKDAGEQFFMGRQTRGFDHYSASIQFNKVGKLEKLVLGDYALQFGQGLSLWSGLSFSKGAAITGLAKPDLGLRQNSSFNEALFFRGVSGTLRLKKFFLTPFFSYKNIDAGMEPTPEGFIVSSLSISGLHRTASETENKNSVSQMVAGSAVEYKSKTTRLGFNAYHTTFSTPLGAGPALYNQFDFAGSQLTNFGANYSFSYRNTYFFGEAAHSLGQGFALINGLISSLSPGVSVAVFHRKYDRDYHSLFNQALSESSTAVNEQGVYGGLVIKPASGWEFSSYFDMFKFPWLKFRVDAPSKGYETLSQITWSPNKRLRINWRYRLERKEENSEFPGMIMVLEDVTRENYRMELFFKMNERFQARSRFEIASYQKGDRSVKIGEMIYQDLIYSPLSSRFSGNLRFALFDTPDSDARIYTFENDVLYSYSMLGYQLKGFRYYLNTRFKVKKGLDLWCRYARIQYPHATEVGSGLEKISGNAKTDIRVQLRYQF